MLCSRRRCAATPDRCQLLLPILVLSFLAACAPRAVTPPPAAPPFARGADEILSALRFRHTSIVTLRSTARLKFSDGTTTRRARQLLLAARPDRLRCEVLSPFGTVFLLTARDERMAAFVHGENTVYRGVASPENMARYANVGVPIRLAIDLIMGTPPIWPGIEPSVGYEEGRIVVTQTSARGSALSWYTADLEPLGYEQRDDTGRLLLRANFSDLRAVAGWQIPTRLTLHLPLSQHLVEIELRDPELNVPLAEGLFELTNPPGSKQIEMDQVFR